MTFHHTIGKSQGRMDSRRRRSRGTGKYQFVDPDPAGPDWQSLIRAESERRIENQSTVETPS